MSDIDPLTGLPKELGVWDSLAKEAQKIRVKLVTKKYGKKATFIDGFDGSSIDVKEIAKQLKSKFACGGTHTRTTIELQGDHIKHIKVELVKLGFSPDSIEVQ